MREINNHSGTTVITGGNKSFQYPKGYEFKPDERNVKIRKTYEEIKKRKQLIFLRNKIIFPIVSFLILILIILYISKRL